MTSLSPIDPRSVGEPLMRRIEAAVSVANISRSALEFDWPECHAKRCAGRHGDVDAAFGMMKTQVMRAIRSELQYEMTTRPDVHQAGDTEEQTAVLALATLLRRYNVREASTFVKAAQLIVDAYPALISVLGVSESAA